MPQSQSVPIRFLLAAALLALMPAAARSERPVELLVRQDVVAVRLTPAAAAALAPSHDPRRAGASELLANPSGSFGTFASQLNLKLEHEFPNASVRHDAFTSGLAGGDATQRLARRWLLHLPRGLTPGRAIEQLRGQPEVELAEAVHLVATNAVPNDSLWSKSYYFYQTSRRDMHAPEAWDITTGDSSQVIAIIDTGVLLTHPDLAGPGPGIGGNIWTNAAEAAGQPGVDDDGNGYVDDVHGWDFVALPDTGIAVPMEDWQDEDSDPNDYVGHGTGVAGIADALTNNHIGVAGTAWNARLMPLRVGFAAILNQSGLIDESAAARAIVYAVRTGATVINCSFSSVPQTDISDALDLAQEAGVVVVTAAGNNGSAHDMAERAEVISVAAVDKNDKLTLFTNTGPYVDLCAAGLFVSTTSMNRIEGADSALRRVPEYSASASGTSFSAPIVCGAAALLQAARHARGLPPLRPAEVRLRLMDTADSIATENPGATGYGSGRLNLLRALTDPPQSAAIWLGGGPVGAPAVIERRVGGASVYIGTLGAHLVCINGAARAVEWDVALPGPAVGSPAAADLGGGSGAAIFIATTNNRVCGFDAGGRVLPGWPHEASHPAEGPASPALADLDGDGLPEIVWGDGQGVVWAWHLDGVPLPGFPVSVGSASSGVWIALADLDGDGAAEVVAAPAHGGVTVLDGAGEPLAGWPYRGAPELYFQHPPIVAMLGDSPVPSVIATETTTYESGVRVLNLDGTTRRWMPVDCLASGSSAMADIDGDAQADLIVYCETGEAKVINGANFSFMVTPTTAPATPGSLTPELITGRNAQGHATVAWSSMGELRVFDGVQQSVDAAMRFGDGAPTFADIDGDGALEMLVGAIADLSLLVYPMRAPATGAGAMWATARGDVARTGNAIPSGAVFRDAMAPRAVTDLRLLRVGPATAELTWSAPSGGFHRRVGRYDIRRSPIAPTDSNFSVATVLPGAPAPGPVGSRETFGMIGPDANDVVYVALTSADSAGNVSHVSNVVRIPTLVTPVATLRAFAADTTSLDFAWASTGNDGRNGHAAAYDLRASRGSLDAASFESAEFQLRVPATQAQGQFESSRLTGLAQGSRYSVAVRAIDSLGYVSLLSNVIAAATAPSALPAAVADLRIARRTSTTFDLEWTSAGRSGRNGQPASYTVCASRHAITPGNFELAEIQQSIAATAPQGQLERCSLLGLDSDVEYWIAVRAVDSLGFFSILSNALSRTTMPRPIRTLVITSSDSVRIALSWTGTMSAADSASGMVYDVAASRRPLDEAGFDAAELHRVVAGGTAGSPLALTLDGLVDGSRYSAAIRARDAEGNVSAMSNVVEGLTTPRILPREVGGMRPISVLSTEVLFAWTSTGRQGRSGQAAWFDLRATNQLLDDRGFEITSHRAMVPATADSGDEQRGTLDHLAPNTHYWAAVRAVDSLGYVSGLSATLEFTTTASLPPKRVDDLRVLSAGTTTLELAWTSIGNTGRDGEAAKYELRGSEQPINANNFERAERLSWVPSTLAKGLEWRFAYVELETGRRYWFAVRAIDASGVKSPLSNIVTIVPGPLAGTTRAGIAVGRLAGGARLFWNVDAASAPFSVRIHILDINGRVCRSFTVPGTSDGVMAWDGRSDGGDRAAPGIYFARLETRFAAAQAKLVLLP